MPRSDSSRSASILLGALLLLGAAACTWQGIKPGADHNRRLYVIGQLQRVSPEAVAKATQGFLGSGFFEVQIEAIQQAVGALPWVAAVSVHRRWPDSVVVRVQEHQAVARWNEHALLGEHDSIFTPPPDSIPEDLVALAGPEGSAATVLDKLPELQAVVTPARHRIRELRLDARGSWEATLENGLLVRLGRSDPQLRLQRLVNQLMNDNGPALESRLEDAAYVDLRYTDGFAVGPARTRNLDQPEDKQGEQHDQKA